jgi:hypothetical protein
MIGMECKRCGKELPVGQRKTCPFCGIYLETIVKPRGPRPKTRPPGRRATIMSLLSVGFVVAAIFILVPFMRSVHKNHMLLHIEETFLELNGRELEFTEDEWEKKLASFSASVENLRKAYPSDHENIEKAERYLNILCGLDPDDPTKPGPDSISEQERKDQRLINTAKDKIIDITELSFTASGAGGNSLISVWIKNSSSESVIAQVEIAFQAFDADGNPSIGSARGDNMWYIRTDTPIRTGETEHFRYSERWGDRNIASVKIEWLQVIYGPNNTEYFRPEVCRVLWP